MAARTEGGVCLCNYAAEFGGPSRFITLSLSPSPLSVAGYTQTGKKSYQQGFMLSMELVACMYINLCLKERKDVENL